MSLITDDWRLKLLAVGLAVLMLAAVAFSQNPPTIGNLVIPLNYTMPPNLILVNRPTKIDITYSGLADAIKNVNTSNTFATVDATHASLGSAVRLAVRVTSISGVTVQNPAPIVFNVDTLQTKDLSVQVIARTAPGWSLGKHDAVCPGAQPTPCVVHFLGPLTWETNLTASVTIPGLLSATNSESSNWPIQLQNSNGFLDLTTCRTQPCASLDVTAVGVHLEASPGSTSSTVALVIAPPTHKPASGYYITDVTITPNTVVISGDAATLGRIRNIVLPALDLSGKTADYTQTVQIPYPDGTSGPVATATVKYSITRDPNASPPPGG
ncbi:MAG TPA: CdaR family protein [Candidatus Dormibacteraeota bacterium]|nr:CdaR family protein [Candidatus Dormibacteraeota bacterium]